MAEILAHLGGGGRLGLFTRLIHRRWWELTSSLRVNGECPQAKDHFEALLTRARLIRKRQELTNRWDRLLGVLGAPCSADLGPRPERRCLQFVSHVSLCLRWHEGVWAPIEAELKQAGFRWSAYLEAFPANLTDYGELIRLRQAAESLPIVLAAKIDHLRWLELEKALGDIVNRLSVCLGNGDSAEVVRDLKQAVSGLDPTRYQQGYERLVDLERRQGELSLRRELLRRLETAAPAWAGAIRNRLRGHDGSIPPGEAQAAWLWRQLHEELEQRAATSIEALQRELEDLSSKLLETTSEVVDRRAWAKVCRMPLPQRQALMGWLKIVQKIGAGTGKRVPVLIREARRCMERARSGVPVWIMPLSRVVENFDPSQTRFDVVIIDEASQSDVMALIAMYMAKEVVIVGDDKQVSPEAIGQQVIQVEQLIEMHLRGIPNRKLYDGRTSVYDLAMTSFGGIISLREHFRCVPDIIQFSNYLWYGGDIVPLRDPSRVAPRPHVVPYAAGGVSDQKVNREEALAIASLIAAAFQQPAYQLNERGQPVSLGIISLVGEEQAREIERLLRRHLEPGELERRRVLCGSAAQFQGDERDVVFLSLVDSSPEKPPLPIRRDERFQKRFNVAASRARDQLWVVYSVNPEVDLQPGDLRRGLIEHALNPAAFTGSLREKELRAESEFERLVLRHLVTANYRVTPQWSVGPLRIDLVVEGGGKRLAIECDGDRFHPPEKLAEEYDPSGHPGTARLEIRSHQGQHILPRPGAGHEGSLPPA